MGIRVRAAILGDAGPIARVQVDVWRTTYAGIVPTEYLAGLSYRDRESKWAEILSAERPAESNFVAETDGGEVVGFAGGGPEREGTPTYRGELYAIYLFEEYQRAGVGRRLVSAVARQLVADGFCSMLVWVLEDNRPACAFYESLGGARVGRQTVTIGGADLWEAAYGWKDVAGLTDETTGGQHDGG